MRNVHKPRGKGYALRVQTPDILVGEISPWTGRPYRKTITIGLGTRVHAEAVRLRDVRLGQLRQLEAEAAQAVGQKNVKGMIDLSPESAREWREMRAEAGDRFDLILTDKLEDAARAGFDKEAKRFADVVLNGKLPLDEALEQYLEDRRPGNPLGLDPLKPATMADVRSSLKHLKAFLGSDATLADVTRQGVFKFRTLHLSETAGLSPTTIDKHMTHLRNLWAWAISDRRILRRRDGKAQINPWVDVEVGVSKKKANREKKKQKREHYTPEEIGTLFKAEPVWGSRKADIIRLALVTGVRADEIASLQLFNVNKDGSGFTIPEGKSESARRFIPLVEDAQRLLEQRVTAVSELQADVSRSEHRLFPEWPQRPSNGKASAVSQWFTHFRRRELGAETDGRLAMHSLRHTWATVARRAGLPRDIRKELGGWAKPKEAMDVYDHGLEEKQLRDWQRRVWVEMKAAGYLQHF